MQPEISFIVPVYNVADYLPHCLQSILGMPVHKEIIVIDDGSTDHTSDVIRDFFRLHPEIVWVQQHNQGVSVARNRGIDLARGRYIQFVDGDDVLLGQGDYANLLKLADEKRIDIVRNLVSSASSTGTLFMTRLNLIPIPKGEDGVICSGTEYFNALLYNWFPSSCTGFYRTEFLRQNAIRFPEKIGKSEDAIFLVDALSCRPDVRLLETKLVAYVYRARENSASHQKPNIASFSQMCEAAKLLRQRAQKFAHLAMQPENAALEDHYYLLHHCTRNVALHEYSNAHDTIYWHLAPEEQAQVRHYFTPEVMAELRISRKVPIEL